jgi:dihydroorotate dehydrogenase electron transfer subunit
MSRPFRNTMKIKQQDLKVLSNKKIAPGHYVIELESEVLCKAAPGQFVQILTDHDQDPLLPRPFSFLDTGKKTLRILYQVVGKGTRLMSQKTPGSALRILGPLGNGFSMSWKRTPSNIVVIGGGVGIPPLYHLVKTFVEKPSLGIKKDQIHVFLGARTKDFLHCEQDLKIRRPSECGHR